MAYETFNLPAPGGVILDTVQYSEAPEPAALWLLSGPLAILIRKKQSATKR